MLPPAYPVTTWVVTITITGLFSGGSAILVDRLFVLFGLGNATAFALGVTGLLAHHLLIYLCIGLFNNSGDR
jgi:hypothetical protein